MLDLGRIVSRQYKLEKNVHVFNVSEQSYMMMTMSSCYVSRNEYDLMF